MKKSRLSTGNDLVTELLLQNAFFLTFLCFSGSKTMHQTVNNQQVTLFFAVLPKLFIVSAKPLR
jgi:hypothetical protein